MEFKPPVLAALLGTVSDAVLILDLDGIIRQSNPVADRLLAPVDGALNGLPMRELIAESSAIQDLLLWGRSFRERELQLRTAQGPQAFLASGSPIPDAQAVNQGAVLALHAVPHRKRQSPRHTGAQPGFRFEDILGQAAVLHKAIQLGRQAASNHSHVLLNGESGTGKEMFAQAIHNHSERQDQPFVAVNCGAIPRELIASELFGYHEGAFTGALRGGRPGKFELADGGTLFLDEIGDMPLQQQVALLRVLQDGTITRVGGARPQVVDVRIICASNQDLREAIRAGAFRQDLYYRLNVSTIQLPALREHPEDIPVLLKAFARKFAAAKGRPALHLDPEVVRRLQAYAWPGNIREFQNVVERMTHALRGDRVTPEHLPDELLAHSPSPVANQLHQPVPAPQGEPLTLRDRLAEEARAEILTCLRANKGNLSRTAQALGMARNTLYRKLRKFGL